MVSGLLMELEDHDCWTIAEAVGHRGPHRLQHLLSRAVWDDEQVLNIAAAWAAGHLDDGDGVLIVDETADEKSSGTAAGAARQYTVGGIALCQVAVTLTYATGREHALIGRALYLPETCAADGDAARPGLPVEGQAGHSLLLQLPRDRGLSRSGRTAHEDDPSDGRHSRRLSRSLPRTVRPAADSASPLAEHPDKKQRTSWAAETLTPCRSIPLRGRAKTQVALRDRTPR